MKILTIFLLCMTNTYAIFNVFENPEQEAIETIIEQAKLPKTKENVKKYAPLIIKVAKNIGVDYHHILSIAWTESHFNPKALSWVGAQGIMQVMPKTKVAIEKEIDKDLVRSIVSQNLEYDYQVTLNIILGTYYVKKLMKRFNDEMLATVAYNMGPTWVGRRLKLRKAIGVRNKYLDKVRAILEEIKQEKEEENPKLAFQF